MTCILGLSFAFMCRDGAHGLFGGGCELAEKHRLIVEP